MSSLHTYVQAYPGLLVDIELHLVQHHTSVVISLLGHPN